MFNLAYIGVVMIGLLHGFEPGHGYPVAGGTKVYPVYYSPDPFQPVLTRSDSGAALSLVLAAGYRGLRAGLLSGVHIGAKEDQCIKKKR